MNKKQNMTLLTFFGNKRVVAKLGRIIVTNRVPDNITITNELQ